MIILVDLLCRFGFYYVDLEKYNLGNLDLKLVEKEGVEIDIKYFGYL